MKTAKVLQIMVIGAAAITLTVIVSKAIKKAIAAGQSAANAGQWVADSIAETMSNGAKIVGEAKAAAEAVARHAKETADGAYLAATGQSPIYNTSYAKAITSDKWDASTKALIGDFNQRHGRARLNYAGWQVFTDGTIISPAGDYLQMDYTAAAMERAGGYAVKDIFSPAGDPFASIYPGAENFTAAGYKNEITTAPLSENAPPYFIAF